MLQLLSAVKLKSSVSETRFAEAIQKLGASLTQQQLLTSTGPIDKRYPHLVIDTGQTDLQTFFVMSFENGARLEKKVAQMTGSENFPAVIHRQIWGQLDRYRFTCWED